MEQYLTLLPSFVTVHLQLYTRVLSKTAPGAGQSPPVRPEC